MLSEARRRIQADSELSTRSASTRLDLVQCDVGQIPMKNNSINALHAGACSLCTSADPSVETNRTLHFVLFIIPLPQSLSPTTGAAMHCWPDLPAAVSEIYRVLKPGGRYFATTFLSSWFGSLQNAEGGQLGPSRQAFQYFESVDQLRSLLESGGFERSKVSIEVLGRACVVIRCEK